jgi:hypothetical protein
MSLRMVCLIAVIWWLCASAPVHSQTAEAIAATDRELTVGVKDAPPFAMKAAEFQRYESIQDGLNALRSSKIDAFVYDKPLLARSLRQKYSYSIRLLDIVFEPQEYAFVLPSDSALRKPLSVAILDAIQSDEWTEMKIRYLGPAAANLP